jgi:hypothetical protein
MLSKFLYIKKTLIKQLWLPIAIEGGNKLFPRLRKHKKMKLFTLTDMDYEEIKAFEENKLTKREDSIVWNYSYQQALRLETELGKSNVLYEGRFEDTLIEDKISIFDNLQCEIMNLDFTSQNPSSLEGRIENEINAQYIIIHWLNKYKKNGVVLIYTTLLDDIEININKLSITFSNNVNFTNLISDMNDKVKFINTAFDAILSNNNYRLFKSNEMILDINGSTNKIFSRAFIILREI